MKINISAEDFIAALESKQMKDLGWHRYDDETDADEYIDFQLEYPVDGDVNPINYKSANVRLTLDNHAEDGHVWCVIGNNYNDGFNELTCEYHNSGSIPADPSALIKDVDRAMERHSSFIMQHKGVYSELLSALSETFKYLENTTQKNI